jgi:hypothetical protein
MSDARFRFRVHEERLAVVRLPAGARIPSWARGSFVNIARTPAELSIVCDERRVPEDCVHESGKVALGIEGTVPMSTIGVMAELCRVLAEARVPVFVLSTHDTDWFLVPADRFEAAKSALESAGHRVEGEAPLERRRSRLRAPAGAPDR